MNARTKAEAWKLVDSIFPTDYDYNSVLSADAGYSIYTPTVENINAWISDLGNRLEVNMPDGETTNVWIDSEITTEPSTMTVLEFCDQYLSPAAIISLCDDSGGILYTGRLGNATIADLANRDLIRVDGLGTENDLLITATKQYIRRH